MKENGNCGDGNVVLVLVLLERIAVASVDGKAKRKLWNGWIYYCVHINLDTVGRVWERERSSPLPLPPPSLCVRVRQRILDAIKISASRMILLCYLFHLFLHFHRHSCPGNPLFCCCRGCGRWKVKRRTVAHTHTHATHTEKIAFKNLWFDELRYEKSSTSAI